MVLTWYELLLFGSVVNLAFSLQAVPDSFETQPRDFGMNKPHLIFHLGTRYPFSVNYGNGYWLKQIVDDKGQYKQFFSYPRFKYDNTKDGLYIDMIVHNGDSLARQTLSDTKSGVQGDFSYQLLDEPRQWQHQINLRLSKSNNTFGKSLYWFNYMSVQNTNPDSVDRQAYSTPIYFLITKKTDRTATVQIVSPIGNQTIILRSSTKLSVFGLSMNISDTHDFRSVINQFQHLIELSHFGGQVKRKDDAKLKEWEDGQVKLLETGDFVNKKYVVLFFYGITQQQNEMFITNGTESKFSSYIFANSSTQLNNLYFPQQQSHSALLKHMVYNLYAGLAFYRGKLYTQHSLLNHQFDSSYTFTPSRLIFPRSFLWDDGFHLSVVVHYNPVLVVRVLRNWCRKIDLFGWIGREQIRGWEISSMMPEVKFIYQDTFEMNPPTLLLPLITLTEQAEQGLLSPQTKQLLDDLLNEHYWRLQKWFRYFIRTQSHHNLMQQQQINKTQKYRWRCKDQCANNNFMGSGLDDYPRTAQLGQISKQHVDLMSWLYFFADGLQHIARYLGRNKPERYYLRKKEEFRVKVVGECLDRKDWIFKDQAVRSRRELDSEHVEKYGYISLFPFMAGLMVPGDYDQHLMEDIKMAFQKTVQLMLNESELMSQDGLRSLSISDKQYGTEQNYWRGAVWMPINYLVLRACKRYYWDKPNIPQLYNTLRGRLIKTVKSNWEETGYLFENYHEGKGHRGFPFYGWTTLLVNIITEHY